MMMVSSSLLEISTSARQTLACALSQRSILPIAELYDGCVLPFQSPSTWWDSRVCTRCVLFLPQEPIFAVACGANILAMDVRIQLWKDRRLTDQWNPVWVWWMMAFKSQPAALQVLERSIFTVSVGKPKRYLMYPFGWKVNYGFCHRWHKWYSEEAY